MDQRQTSRERLILKWLSATPGPPYINMFCWLLFQNMYIPFCGLSCWYLLRADWKGKKFF